MSQLPFFKLETSPLEYCSQITKSSTKRMKTHFLELIKCKSIESIISSVQCRDDVSWPKCIVPYLKHYYAHTETMINLGGESLQREVNTATRRRRRLEMIQSRSLHRGAHQRVRQYMPIIHLAISLHHLQRSLS